MRLDKFIAQQFWRQPRYLPCEIRGNRVTVDGDIMRAFKLLPEHAVAYDGAIPLASVNTGHAILCLTSRRDTFVQPMIRSSNGTVFPDEPVAYKLYGDVWISILPVWC